MYPLSQYIWDTKYKNDLRFPSFYQKNIFLKTLGSNFKRSFINLYTFGTFKQCEVITNDGYRNRVIRSSFLEKSLKNVHSYKKDRTPRTNYESRLE